jgi:hypothetical protein
MSDFPGGPYLPREPRPDDGASVTETVLSGPGSPTQMSGGRTLPMTSGSVLSMSTNNGPTSGGGHRRDSSFARAVLLATPSAAYTPEGEERPKQKRLKSVVERVGIQSISDLSSTDTRVY